MYAAKNYRRKSDGLVIEAIQYQLPWEHDNAIGEVAGFVLQMDLDKATSVMNEQVLDVVKPLTPKWDVRTGKAPIVVIDPVSGQHYEVDAGEWLARIENGDKSLILIQSNAFSSEYELDERVHDQWSKLSDFIYKHFPWDGEEYHAVAANVAAALIGAGWRKEHNHEA